MFFNSVKEINMLRKEMKRMSNIYLKVTTEKFSKLRFSGFKKFVNSPVFGKLQLTQISLKFKTSSCNLNIRVLGSKLSVWLFNYFNFERSYDVLRSNSPSIFMNKNINFNKNETKLKMKNPPHSLR